MPKYLSDLEDFIDRNDINLVSLKRKRGDVYKYRAVRQPAQNFAMKHLSRRSAGLILGLCPDFR